MTRRKMRETIFTLLFPLPFQPEEDVRQQASWFFEEHGNIDPEDRLYMEEKVNAVIDCLPSIDEKIQAISEGWQIDRIGKAELAILRLAVYEITEDTDIPTKVAISEAVELSKKYCSDETPRFVNGVLAKLA